MEPPTSISDTVVMSSRIGSERLPRSVLNVIVRPPEPRPLSEIVRVAR
ncbi:hypothetical protein SAMN06272735_8033 [Streptomyces sp. TLI_55]|nr:hypothetical protein SAMN06272735_8033 [Streptomyces sp. TLI_55]